MSSDETVWVEVEVFAQTDDAILVQEGLRPIWIPKSQIRDLKPDGPNESIEDFDRGAAVKIEIPYWLCEKKRLDDWVCEP